MDDPENKAFESGNPVIYTVGTSTRSREEFLDLLRAYGIGAVLDVRRFPTSRRYAHFDRTFLASWLAASGINYHYLGDLLGGYRRGGYEAYTTTATFRQGLEQAIGLARRGPAAIMCCERFPWRCHRRFIARHLAALGWRVVHILDHDRTYCPGQPQDGCIDDRVSGKKSSARSGLTNDFFATWSLSARRLDAEARFLLQLRPGCGVEALLVAAATVKSEEMQT